MSLIQIENLTYRHPDGSPGIANINFSIEQGEFVIIAGRNGSGKTTLCKHFNGLLRSEKGRVLINNVAVDSNLRQTRQSVGMVFQNPDSQIIGETVYNDIAFGPENLRLAHEEIQQRVERAIQIVGLEHLKDQRPHTLSGGEKKRLAIAGVLAMDPEIIIFDEPFSNLDYPGSIQLLHHIIRLKQEKRTIIVITHELEITIAQADRLVILEKGMIVRDGSPQDIIAEVEQFGVREPCSSKLGQGIQSWLN